VELKSVDKDATLGGLESTVGMTSAEAFRWERVIVPSELGHMMTIGLPVISVPKPIAIHPSFEEPVLWRTYCTLEPLTVAATQSRELQYVSPVTVVTVVAAVAVVVAAAVVAAVAAVVVVSESPP